MKERYKYAHMNAAQVYANLSYCVRRKVGAVVVKDDRIVSIGYNGTPPGEDNTCEDEHFETKPSVLHAEHNALLKLDRAHEQCTGAALFVTMAPCKACAELIINHGITDVFYRDQYRRTDGIDLLQQHGVNVQQLQ